MAIPEGVLRVAPGDVIDGEHLEGLLLVGSGARVTNSRLVRCDLSQLEGCHLVGNVLTECVLPPMDVMLEINLD